MKRLCFPFQPEFAKFIKSERSSSFQALMLAVLSLPIVDFDIRLGVGMDCVFRIRRLAMPGLEYTDIIPRLFYAEKPEAFNYPCWSNGQGCL